MKRSDFASFFQTATGKPAPYDYQCRLACGPNARADQPKSLTSSARCSSQLIDIPTGLGKTAAVVLSWLWNRFHPEGTQWPRRLVYCLPMRTLVEQTEKDVRDWLKNLIEQFSDNTDLKWLQERSPTILMGGEEKDLDWDVWPEKPAILIGTQDMLLSRALNRGYGMSRYRWPMHFALLNNDCLWVMDETQLMGVGVETSAQLDGFRQSKGMSSFSPCPTWWMSATLHDSRLATVDHPQPNGGWQREELSKAEQSSGRPHELITAPKNLSPAPLALSAATKGSYAKNMAEMIAKHHHALPPRPTGSLTLVVVNRVYRAREIYQALTNKKKPLHGSAKPALIHSRFRPVDREKHMKTLRGEGDRIVIATQAVEAGVDVSARLLITELAPWSSLVQRMGRCNRYADIPDAEVLWVDIDLKDAKDDLQLPYNQAELDKARAELKTHKDASPQSLSRAKVEEEPQIRPVIRRRDLVDLFDTTPDICGQDLDISRYIRDGEDSDVQFFWRNLPGSAPEPKEPQPVRDELCRVSIGDTQDFFKKNTTRAWRWNPLEEKWEATKAARPGAVYLIDAASGGYDDDLGWTGEQKVQQLTPHPPPDKIGDTHNSSKNSFIGKWVELKKHTREVVDETRIIAQAFSLLESEKAALLTAALWHDIGKAHEDFQKMLRDGPFPPENPSEIYAKSANPINLSKEEKDYRRLRHELASALAWLLSSSPDTPERDLIAYIIAAHHGKVRLSIRSLPDEEEKPKATDVLFARGIWQGDKLPPVEIDDLSFTGVEIDLSFMQMGEGERGPSWLARTIALRDRLGPFRLAFLETLLRAADARASRPSTP